MPPGTWVRSSILLEAILALLFIVLTVGAVAGLFIQSVAQVRQAEYRTRAMMLAKSKIAELSLGIADFTESTEGDFNNHPPNYYWKMQFESTEIPELQRLKVTVLYDDPTDGCEFTTYRLYSPSLNLSAAKMKEIAADPVRMRSLGSGEGGLENLMSMLSEFPGGTGIMEALLRGGVPGMMDLFNKVVSGKISPEDLMASLGTESTEENSLSSKMVKSGADENSPLAWSDYDTAGIGEKPSAGEGLASRDRKDKTGQDNTTGEESPTTRPSGRGGPGDARPGDEGRDETGTRTMTRDQAIQRMTEMLRRMATERKKR